MSKQIDWTQPLDAETRAYAQQYPGLHAGMLQANAEAFPAETVRANESLEGDDDIPPYDEWTVQDLAAEAKRRNEQEGTKLKTSGTKAELVKVLEDDDAARP